jgi:hypothetical protein
MFEIKRACCMDETAVWSLCMSNAVFRIPSCGNHGVKHLAPHHPALQSWRRSFPSDHKRELVEALYAEGAFNGKSAANYVATILGMGRATVYKHLKGMRDDAEPAE